MRQLGQSRDGFSLAEVLIAILVIVIGLAGVTSSLVYGVKNSKKGRELSESSQIARTIFEYMQEAGVVDTAGVADLSEWPDQDSGINDEPETRRLLTEAPFGGVPFLPQYVERYKRNIKIERMSMDSTSHRSKLAKVTVRVYWTEGPSEHFSELVGVIRHDRPL